MSSIVTTGSSATCPGCGAGLVTEGLGPHQAVLCPACCATFLLRPPGFAVRTSRLAIVCLMLGIASLVGTCLTGIPAILAGILALRDINRSQGRVVGRRLAIGGMTCGGLFGLLCAPVTLALLVPLARLVNTPSGVRNAPPPQPEKAVVSPESQAQRTAMRRIAGGLTVMTIDDASQVAELIPEPLFQSRDPTRDSHNGSIWGYGERGRPAALLSLSLYPPREGTPGGWMFELNSLSSLAVEAKIPGQQHWATRPGGLEFKEIPDAPAAAEEEAGRTRQCDEISSRFGGFELTGKTPDAPLERIELRLLPQPIHRYRDPDRGQLDGAVFVMTLGNDPEVILVIELIRDGEKTAWNYALTRLSFAGLEVELDGQGIWTQPPLSETTAADPYWLFFQHFPDGNLNPQ